jgi:FAD/FMN-containing dehydrogenase
LHLFDYLVNSRETFMSENSTQRRFFLKGVFATSVAFGAMRRGGDALVGDALASDAPAPATQGTNLATDISPYFRGEVITPSSPGYDARRRLVNAAVDKRPSLIVRCLGAADVVAAVRYARKNQLEIAVRGGGHHVAGYAMSQGGLVIDLSLMSRSIIVDPTKRTARVEGGARSGDVIAETLPFGLAAITAGVANVGIGGLTLGGGNGDLSPTGGFASDNLVSVDMVTADGNLITASADQNPDLFWAVRGAGANFGVVTSFVLKLHPMPAQIQSGMLIYELRQAKKVLTFLREFSARPASEPCSIVCYIGPLPPDPHLPPDLRGAVAITLSICHTGTAEQAAADLQTWRDLEKPAADMMTATSYLDFLHATEAGYPHNRQFWDDRHFPELSDKFIGLLIEQATRLSKLKLSGHQFIAFYPLKGAMSREPEVPSAYSLRGGWELPVMSFWNDAADDATQINWVESVMDSVRKANVVSPGAYMNFVSRSTEERVRAFYGEQNYARLQQLKRKYDPDNVFHLNPNIIPAVS